MSSDKRTIENDLNNLKYFYFLFLTLKQKHGVLPGKALEGDGTEDKHKGLVSCRNTLQGHCVAAEVQEFLNKASGTGLCIYALPSFFPTPWPSFASQASDQGWMWWGENARGRWRSVLHSMLCQSVPLEAIHTQSSQICGGLRDRIRMHPWLVLFFSPTYSMSQWKLETEIWFGIHCPSHLQVQKFPCHHATKYSHQQGLRHITCIMTAKHKSRLDSVNDQKEKQTTLAEREK